MTAGTATLVELLRPSAVPFEALHARYGAVLELVRKLIGVVPNCDPYLEIWPPGFRSYNVMVPNLLDLPFSLWRMGGGAPIDVVGLAMYVSSRVASCAYCSAHTCSFALRRGAGAGVVGAALDGDDAARTQAQRAAIGVARALAENPISLSAAQRAAMDEQFTPAESESVVLGVAMMGFLNKFMDAIGVELEPTAVAEVTPVIAASGWAPGKHGGGGLALGSTPPVDSWRTKVDLVRFIPSAIALDRRWTGGMPARWPAVGDALRARVGHDFPVLGRLRSRRAVRAIAVMLRDNLDAATTVMGLAAKCRAGLAYAEVVGDAALERAVRAVAARVGGGGGGGGGGDKDEALLALARAASPSPAIVDEDVVARCRAAGVAPAAIVEVVVWLSVLQLLHRLLGYYGD